jgi:small-conductance mechanosensitive channel
MKDDRQREKSVIELLDESLSQSLDDFSDLLTAKVELAKLDAIELLSGIAANVVLVLISVVGVLCLFIALALYLGEFFGQRSLGFLAVGGFLVGAVVFLNVFKPMWIRNLFLDFFLREYQRRQPSEPKEEQK